MGFFESGSEMVADIGGIFTGAFEVVSNILWAPAVGETAAHPTLVGYLLIAGVVVSIVSFAITKLLRLAKIK